MEYTYVETSYALMATLTCVQKINQVLFLLYIFSVYFNNYEHNYSALRYFYICRRIIHYKVVLYHGGTFGGTARLHGLACHGPDYSNAPADSPVRAALQHHKRLARTPSRPVHASASAYNEEDNFLVRTGLQRHGRFICLVLRPIHPPRPTRLSARLTVPAISSPVRTGLQRRGRLICCPGKSGDIFLLYFINMLIRLRTITWRVILFHRQL